MLEVPGQQISFTDPDARSMATSGRGTGMVGYNVQTAVDAKHHLIVAHEVTNQGHDRQQLHNMAAQATAVIGTDHLDVVAYRCPAGEELPRRTKTLDRDLVIYRYWSSLCGSCSLKLKCATGKERQVSRWEHEQVLQAAEARLDKEPERMRVRRCTVEYPFGTLKSWMGHTHFLMKTKANVSTEMSLHVLAYNLKRVMSILGVRGLINAIQAALGRPVFVLMRENRLSATFYKSFGATKTNLESMTAVTGRR